MSDRLPDKESERQATSLCVPEVGQGIERGGDPQGKNG